MLATFLTLGESYLGKKRYCGYKLKGHRWMVSFTSGAFPLAVSSEAFVVREGRPGWVPKPDTRQHDLGG